MAATKTTKNKTTKDLKPRKASSQKIKGGAVVKPAVKKVRETVSTYRYREV